MRIPWVSSGCWRGKYARLNIQGVLIHAVTVLCTLAIGDPAVIALVEAGEPQHVEEGEEEDVLEAVARLQQRDAGLQAAEPSVAHGDEDEESDEVPPLLTWP